MSSQVLVTWSIVGVPGNIGEGTYSLADSDEATPCIGRCRKKFTAAIRPKIAPMKYPKGLRVGPKTFRIGLLAVMAGTIHWNAARPATATTADTHHGAARKMSIPASFLRRTIWAYWNCEQVAMMRHSTRLGYRDSGGALLAKVICRSICALLFPQCRLPRNARARFLSLRCLTAGRTSVFCFGFQHLDCCRHHSPASPNQTNHASQHLAVMVCPFQVKPI